MKLSICKTNMPTLAEEKLCMNRYNVTRVMSRLAKTVIAMMASISIPACAFKTLEYMFHTANFDTTQAITMVFDGSVGLILYTARFITLTIGILTIIKFLKTGDNKQLGKDILAITVSYFFMNISKYIVYVLPVIVSRFYGL